jgi:hypothetical protein
VRARVAEGEARLARLGRASCSSDILCCAPVAGPIRRFFLCGTTLKSLVQAKFIALDSSQLIQWIEDQRSANKTRRSAASDFQNTLLENGCVTLLCWHHFEGLLATQDVAKAEASVRFIRSMPLVGWIRCVDGTPGLGSIVDILAVETKAALHSAGDVIAIREHASAELISLGSGQEAIQPYMDCWRDLQPYFWKRAERNREIVAISRSSFVDISKMKVESLAAGRMRREDEIVVQFEGMEARLTIDIEKRGDKRMSDHEKVAKHFLQQVARDVPTPPPSASTLYSSYCESLLSRITR